MANFDNEPDPTPTPPAARPQRTRREQQPRVELEAPEAGELHAQDHWHVRLDENWEVTFWAREFGCTTEELREAVRQAGEQAGAVRAWLHEQHQQRRN